MKRIISISLIICLFILCSCSEPNNNSINISKKTAYDSNGMPYDSITVIGPGKSISYNLVINRDTNDGKIDRIEDRAFLQCNKITSVKISGDINIGKNAFSECANLTNVSITGTTIGKNAFFNCDNLQSLSIQDATIEEHAFYDCNNLTSLTIKDCKIETKAFENCTNLKSINIDSGSIGLRAFTGCENLESVTLTGSFSKIENSAFNSCKKHITVNYSGTVSDFDSDTKDQFGRGLINQGGGVTVNCSDGKTLRYNPYGYLEEYVNPF